MAFCKKCGNNVDIDADFCVSCGTPVGNTAGKVEQQPEQDNSFKTQIRQKTVYGVVNLEDLPKGHVIDDRYEVKAKIGQGGFGAVYRAFDRNMKIDKALKVLPEAITCDREAMESLGEEAETMVRLNHHNIVRVYDFQGKGPLKYIDMEYVDGKSLTDIKLDSPSKKLPENEVRNLADQIAIGLSYAHSKKIIHKDIKPQNILLSKNGKVKIMDFGISETVRSSMSRVENSSSAGTLLYMSPEQIKGMNVGQEADIYSFGITLYELLSGKPPFNTGAIEHQIINEKPANIEDVSSEMNAILQKCLTKDYMKRFRSFKAVLNSLNSPPVKETFKPESKLENKTNLIKWLVPAGVLVCGIIIAMYVTLNITNKRTVVKLRAEQSTVVKLLAEQNSVVKLLAEQRIIDKAKIIATQCSIFLKNNPDLNKDDFYYHFDFKEISVQKVGEHGYSFLVELPEADEDSFMIWSHQNPELIGLPLLQAYKKYIGSSYNDFKGYLKIVRTGKGASGYYTWKDEKNVIKNKFVAIQKIEQTDYIVIISTFIEDFTTPIIKLIEKQNTSLITSNAD